MRVDIVMRPDAAHQQRWGEALASGLRRHGITARIVPEPTAVQSDVAACWGWVHGRSLAAERPVLVMERAYVGNRFEYLSLGWDGLNGRARFPIVDDGGLRWRNHFQGLMRLIRNQGSNALILGQVTGDAALVGCSPAEFYQRCGDRARAMWLHQRFRPHPTEVERYGERVAHFGFAPAEGSLDEALSAARVAMAWNSNALTDAALAGVPVIAGHHGAMAWPIAGQGLDCDAPGPPLLGRDRWAHRLAYCQWSETEVADGTAWSSVRTAMEGGQPWHSCA